MERSPPPKYRLRFVLGACALFIACGVALADVPNATDGGLTTFEWLSVMAFILFITGYLLRLLGEYVLESLRQEIRAVGEKLDAHAKEDKAMQRQVTLQGTRIRIIMDRLHILDPEPGSPEG